MTHRSGTCSIPKVTKLTSISFNHFYRLTYFKEFCTLDSHEVIQNQPRCNKYDYWVSGLLGLNCGWLTHWLTVVCEVCFPSMRRTVYIREQNCLSGGGRAVLPVVGQKPGQDWATCVLPLYCPCHFFIEAIAHALPACCHNCLFIDRSDHVLLSYCHNCHVLQQ